MYRHYWRRKENKYKMALEGTTATRDMNLVEGVVGVNGGDDG